MCNFESLTEKGDRKVCQPSCAAKHHDLAVPGDEGLLFPDGVENHCSSQECLPTHRDGEEIHSFGCTLSPVPLATWELNRATIMRSRLGHHRTPSDTRMWKPMTQTYQSRRIMGHKDRRKGRARRSCQRPTVAKTRCHTFWGIEHQNSGSHRREGTPESKRTFIKRVLITEKFRDGKSTRWSEEITINSLIHMPTVGWTSAMRCRTVAMPIFAV